MLRAAETKEHPNQWKPYIRSEFKKHADMVPVSAHQRIEFFLRQGQNQLDLMLSESVTDLNVFGMPQSDPSIEKEENENESHL